MMMQFQKIESAPRSENYKIKPSLASTGSEREMMDQSLDSIAKVLGEMRNIVRGNSVEKNFDPSEVAIQKIRRLVQLRRNRVDHFSGNLFADPAWDILLQLALMDLMQRRITVTELCVASRIPFTTALRWIATLESYQIIERKSDPLDQRRHFLSLSEKGAQSMTKYLECV